MNRTLAPTTFAIAFGLSLLAAACGNGETVTETGNESPEPTVAVAPETTEQPDSLPPQGEIAADAVVMIWSETGGCAQGGPNCFRYEVLADGTVNSFREGSTDVEVTAQIDVATVTAFIDAVNATDVPDLVATLPEGEMTAAFDGTDYVLEAPFADVILSSVDVEFVSSEALFSTANDVAAAAAAVAMPESQMR